MISTARLEQLGSSRGAVPRAWPIALALAASAFGAGCQNEDNHPPFAPGCTSDCKPTIGISIGSGTGPSTTPDAGFDASAGTLTGNVFALNDQSFANEVPFTAGATVTADGASGTPVSATWNGAAVPPVPYLLSGVAALATNWISVAPAAVQGDALPTIQAVETDATDSADLVVIGTAAIDGVLTQVSAVRAPALAQVVLFFRNAGTGAALSGVQATMSASEVPAYAAASGWVLQDDTTVTNASGLVVFGNVTLPAAGSSTQVVSVSRPATATTAAISGGQFSIQVVEGAVTLASIGVRL